MNSRPSASLSAAVAHEISNASARAKSLFSRHSTLSPNERAEMHGLWEYEKRLGLIQGLLAIAQPSAQSTPAHEVEETFRNALVKHGSATEDNLEATSAISLHTDTHEVSFRVGQTGPPLGRLLLDAHDAIGTAEFFDEKLSQLPDLASITPQMWENAYRVLMLAMDALLTCPRHSPPDSEGGPEVRPTG